VAKGFVRMRTIACSVCLLLVLSMGAGPAAGADEDRFLPPEQVFRYTVAAEGDGVAVHWTLPPGYYAYQQRMSLESATPGAVLGPVQYPKGEIHKDEYFGAQEVFRANFVVRAAVNLAAGADRAITLKLKIQGCADAGLCYPPQLTEAKVQLPPAPAAGGGSGLDAMFAAHRAQGSDDFLPPDEAFRFDASADGPDRVRLTWQIAGGYYLYRSRIKAESSGTQAQLGALALPAGIEKTDEYFGKQEIYHGALTGELPVARSSGGALDVPLDVTYQGCAEAGLCYQPIKKTLLVHLPAGSGGSSPASGFVSEQDRLAGLIRSGNLLAVLGTFFGLGLLLAFTPCVLPMVPILSGIIAGQGAVSTARAFSLSLVYVLGMAITYTVAGALFAAAGQQVQAVFQQPWIVVLFALLFVVLALSMFGLFTLQVPAALQTRLATVSNRQRAGSFIGVAVMGALSALIITTCVAPPLIATLTVIGQSGDMVRGAAALFAMSLGMGTPLLVVGASAGKLLPRAGAWMDTVKQLFGVLMLAVAAWMLTRIVSERWTLVLWAVPALVGALVLWRMRPAHVPSRMLARAAGVLAGLYGVALLAGAATGGSDPLEPLPALASSHESLPFTKIKSLADLNAQVAQARSRGAPVLLDFYADWCVSCKEMERYTFSDPAVERTLQKAVLLRADVTRNDAQDQELLKHFGIFGPPTIAFYSTEGREQRAYRVVGYMKAAEFDALAERALFAQPGT
jgi:thiol:disulfide interchange protein DsbD